MKKQTNILCRCNLVLFIASFVLLAVISGQVFETGQSRDHSHTAFIQKEDPGAVSSLQQLSEKEETETETENDLELTAFFLPFFVSQFKLQEIKKSHGDAITCTSVRSQPIYVAVSNFRI